MGSSKSRIFLTEANLSTAKERSLGNLEMSGPESQISLQKRAVSPEEIVQEATLLNLAQSLTMCFH
jgi:hypothetical protein